MQAVSPVDIVMLHQYHHDVRTTLTLDDDVAAKLQAEMRRSGRPFREVVNDTLRRGLLVVRTKVPKQVSLPAFSLGLNPGLDLDNVQRLLDDLSERNGA